MSRQAHVLPAQASQSPARSKVEPRSPLRSEQVATPAASEEIPAQIARAERLGHSLERINASAAPPIQRVIYSDKGKKAHNAFKDISRTNWYKNQLDDAGRAWAHHLHGKEDEHYNLPELHAKVAELKASDQETPALPVKEGASKKRKREAPVIPRQTGPAVGTQVDYATAKQFRTERRVIRRLKKAGKSPGDKNLYTKRYKPPGQKPFKLLTSSIPPSSLPSDYATRSVDELAENRLGQTFHSEAVTDKIEKNYPPFKKQRLADHEHYSASSREQCESCRYNYPPQKPTAHKFGTYYSGTTDHLANEDLRKKLVANKGIIGNLDLTAEERHQVAEGRADAASARQYHPQQNPLLNSKRASLKDEDSEGEQSSDDDDLYVTHDLDWGSTQGYGKGKVHVLPRRSYFSNEEFEEEKVKTQSLLTKRKERPGEEEVAVEDEHGDPSSEGEGEEEEEGD